MGQEEMLSLVDEKGNIIGQVTRDKCHQDPSIIHQAVHLWIFNRKGQILWQKRSIKKKKFPRYWDISCAGHVPVSESCEETLRRELAEELGLKNVKVTFVRKYLKGDQTETELIYLYYAVIDKKEREFALQKEEVEQVMWIDPSEALQKAISHQVKSTDWIFVQLPMILQKAVASK